MSMTEHVSSPEAGNWSSKWNTAIFNVIYYICAFPAVRTNNNHNSVAVGMAISFVWSVQPLVVQKFAMKLCTDDVINSNIRSKSKYIKYVIMFYYQISANIMIFPLVSALLQLGLSLIRIFLHANTVN